MTARPFAFNSPTPLWHPSAGWRTFQPGEMDPGDAWSEVEGGMAFGEGARTQAEAHVLQARERAEALQRQLVARDHDLALLSAKREAAEAKLRDLEQRALAAERRADEAEAELQAAVRDKNRLTDFVTRLQAEIAARDADEPHDEPPADGAAAEIPEIPDDYETLPFFKLRALASRVAGQPLTDKKACLQAINRHLADAVVI